MEEEDARAPAGGGRGRDGEGRGVRGESGERGSAVRWTYSTK